MAQACRAGALQASAAAALVRPERAAALKVPASQKVTESRNFFQGAALVKHGEHQRRNHVRAAGPSAVLSEERPMESMGSVAVKKADVPKPDVIDAHISSGKTLTAPVPKDYVSRYAPDEPRKGSDILVEALEREGVRTTFAYPGGASMEIHQALTRSQ